MDSLLANYGSDEEDAEFPPGSPKPAVVKTSALPAPSWHRQSLFGSLPPPKNSAAEKEHVGYPSSTLRTPKIEPEALLSGFFDDPSPAVGRPSFHEQDVPEAKPSSLFAQRLPPPASSKPLFETLPRPSTLKAKQVVEFKPPINYALLEKTEEDDSNRSRKRSKLSEERDGAMEPNNGGGLMSFLPPPKNSLGAGAALGGGSSHGSRRTVMETAYDSYKIGNEVNSNSGNIKIEKVEVNVERPTLGAPNYAYEVESAVQSGEGFDAQPDIGYHDHNFQEPYVENRYGNHAGYTVGNGNGNDEQSWQYPDANAYPRAGIQPSQGEGVLAEAMKKERRKGRDEPPPQMIEVKQADLTGGSRVREDQIRSTGIAFGPSYQPAASNKDKPSKLHRRKHQIGALYFDMKQNEMNLLDRRAKGNLTKAETQAKYGW